MEAKDLEMFSEVPFLFWVKDEAGRYLWGNRAICRLAGEDIAGKTDYDLVWSDNAESLQAADRQVFASGNPIYLQEHVDASSRGKATLNVCKWLGKFNGGTHCFGISFTIE